VRRVPSALLVEPSDDVAALVEHRLRSAGMACRRVPDAEAGWRLFAQAPPDAVFTALSTPRRDAAWLLRRMQEDYLGSLPPVYGLVEAEAPGPLLAAARDLDLDGAIIGPSVPGELSALVVPALEEPAAHRAARLAELFELSLLTGDLQGSLKLVCERVARAFRVDDCALDQSSGGGDYRCQLAAALGTTVLVDDASFLAAPLDVPGGGCLGTLALVAGRTRRFLSEERHSLRALARRLGLELAWRSAHERLASEHDRLRQSAVLDPLCGILTRAAFEEALGAQLGGGGGAAMAVAVIDVIGLRQINDRLGHEAGDATLAQLADAVRSGLRPTDLVGRVGGDEIGVALAGTSPREARLVLESLARTVLETRFYHHEAPLPVRVRIGVTDAGTDREAAPILARALGAVAEAKKSGAAVHHIMHGDAGESLPEVQVSVETGDVLAPGTTLGGMYQILHEISRGAMGVVYRAEDLGLRRPVAVKVLRPEFSQHADVVTRFRNEAAMLASVRHEHLVAVYSFGAQDEGVFFVMELVEGESLSELLARLDEAGDPAPVELAARVVTQVAGALEVLHKAGAIHRDVKPANIVLDRARDRAVLVDVGVARRGEPGATEAAGTPGFAAPESFMRSEEGPGTDVYGLTATAYMLLTNLAPFGGGDVNKVIRRQLADAPAPISLLRPGLPAALDRVFARGLAPALRDRFASAAELATAFNAALADRGPEPHSGVHPILPEGPCTRGALFRIAYRILGNRLGTAWVRASIDRHPELRDVLRPTVGPLSWYPVDRMARLLAEVPPSVRDPDRVARELGRAMMTATFARFYGAEPQALATFGPEAVFADAPRFWPRLHSWGQIFVDTAPTFAKVRLTRTPRDPLVCRLVEGSVERIAELSGGAGARSRQLSCESLGAPACVFEVVWSAGVPLPR
jgi:serine/threonine-protein kinase